MVKEHRKNIYPENIKNFTDAVLKESQDQNFAKKFGLPGISDNVIKMFLYDMIIGGTDTILTSIRWFIVYMLYWSNIEDKIYILNLKIVRVYHCYKHAFMRQCGYLTSQD